ncbi:MAG: hypothetical protein Q8P24_16355 [Desulfobacterales bacterium]|nr:hypothetical protein [Desulfobacterales bacterium]
MKISKTRVNNVSQYVSHVAAGKAFFVSFSGIDGHEKVLQRAGFTKELNAGEKVLPAPFFGPQSLFNAEGKEIPLKDQPMETAYRQVEWHLKDWGGYEHSGINNIAYQRYPRRVIPPPSIELQIRNNADGKKLCVSDKLWNEQSDHERIKHAINLFLEVFGEFEILDEDLLPAFKVQAQRLNWEVLPKGSYPWKKICKIVMPLIKQAKKDVRSLIMARIERINASGPDFIATGKAGFHGYIIFGFENKRIYVLESIYFGNATYVFDKDWEELSQKTKAEILNQSLQKERIVHRETWLGEINRLLA